MWIDNSIYSYNKLSQSTNSYVRSLKIISNFAHDAARNSMHLLEN